jgi:very-short-patch-repair endonuclease
MDRPELLGPANLNALTSAVKDLSRRLHEAERKQEPEKKLATLRAALLTVQEELREAVQAHIRESAVVFTTSTLAYLSSEASPISDIAWSSVLVDEVTMVPPAQCVFLGSLARSRFLLAGDPRQLGPVFESLVTSSRASEWMGRDIFDKGGLSQGDGEARTIHLSDRRVTRIDTQRRCCAGIWAGVHSLYPHVSSGVNEMDLEWLRALPPREGESVVLLDTSALAARCEKAHQSWRNLVSGELAMEVACAAVGEAQQDLSIAIIAPYRAQVRLLTKWLRHEARSENPAYRRIEAGTVHQFQGSDADYVIFDVVDGRERTELGVLLRGDVGLRLVNVAITRARGKVVIIADRAWFQRVARREHNPLLWDFVVGTRPMLQVTLAARIPATAGINECESPIEEALLAAMREYDALAGVVLQYEIRDERGRLVTRADFAFPELQYAVYCDGAEWHLRHDRWQKDCRQRNTLTELGWSFSVFTGAEVRRDAGACAQRVMATYERIRERLKA